MQVQQGAEDRLYAALRDVDSDTTRRIRLDDPVLRPQQAFRRLFTGVKRA
jgi:hypothetical protein